MPNLDTLENALLVAARAHSGQTDKDGKPYVTHLLRVWGGCDDEICQIVGILHDIIEDTPTTMQDLADAGFSDAVLKPIECLTHRREEDYHNYIKRCKSNEIARLVKLSDLEDNSAVWRSLMRPHSLLADTRRLIKYHLSWKYLKDSLPEHVYVALMQQLEGLSLENV